MVGESIAISRFDSSSSLRCYPSIILCKVLCIHWFGLSLLSLELDLANLCFTLASLNLAILFALLLGILSVLRARVPLAGDVGLLACLVGGESIVLSSFGSSPYQV